MLSWQLYTTQASGAWRAAGDALGRITTVKRSEDPVRIKDRG